MAHCNTFDHVSSSQVNESDEEDEEFYFEGVQLALKGNKDYMNLLKSLVLLEAQRKQIIENSLEPKRYEDFLALKENVLKHPLLFVKKLQDGTIQPFPDKIKIEEVPNIDWSKYNIVFDEEQQDSPIQQHTDEKKDESKSKTLVRGRTFDETKPDSFNKLWSNEEQRHLEQLLIKYPPEENESNRWKKIAAELGNRTPKQVCSRVQKYFIKLHKAGLPVPGRIPKLQPGEKMQKSFHKHQKYNRLLFRPTTFFPSSDQPIYMCDYDEDGGVASSSISSHDKEISSTPMDIDESPHDTVENIVNRRKLIMLKIILKEKLNEHPNFQHTGHVCNLCKEQPLRGIRWHCLDCPPSTPINFCTDCVISQLESEKPHPLTHQLRPVHDDGPVPSSWEDNPYFQVHNYEFSDTITSEESEFSDIKEHTE